MIPFEIPVPVEECPVVWAKCDHLLGGNIDASCKNPSRAYFEPSHPHPEGLPYKVYEGHLLRVEDLPELPANCHQPHFGFTPNAAQNGDCQGESINRELPGHDFNAQASNETTASILERHGWEITRSGSSWNARRPGKDEGNSASIGNYGPGRLHIYTTNAAPFAVGRNYKPFSVKAFLDHDGDFTAAARDLAEQGFGVARSQEKGTRPEIDADEADATIYAPFCWGALQRANADEPRLFRMGGSIVRVEVDDGSPSLRAVDEKVLAYELARAATFVKKKAKGRGQDARSPTFRVHPPKNYVQDMLADDNPPFPYLRRIVASPVFAEDGTLQTEPGYHPAAGLVIPTVPEHPTEADIKRAVEWILRPLSDFPFVSTADRTSAIAFALTLFARDLIKGPVPMGDIEATGPGTGKGLLADTILIPAIGHNASVMTQWSDEEEGRKRITAVLKSGKCAVLLDNVTKPLNSGTFAAALTALDWEDRMMATHEMRSFLVRCMWLMTANNPVMSTEIARRCVRIRLDAKCERAWQRDDFSIPNLREWMHRNRGQLIAAYLTLIQSWLCKGRPKGNTRMGSYEDWSGVIGGVLDVAGQHGFLDNLEEFYDAADIEGAGWRALVQRWYEVHKTQEVTTAVLFDIATEVENFPLNGKTERGQRTSLGTALLQKRDSIISGFQIVEVEQTRNKARIWALKSTENRPEPLASIADPMTDSVIDTPESAEPMGPAEPFDTP